MSLGHFNRVRAEEKINYPYCAGFWFACIVKKVRILVVCKSFFNDAGGPKDKQDG